MINDIPWFIFKFLQFGVKGLATVCRNCAHGGHMAHMFRWFEKNNHCPFGCGCECTHFQNFSPDRTDIFVRTGPPHKQTE